MISLEHAITAFSVNLTDRHDNFHLSDSLLGERGGPVRCQMTMVSRWQGKPG